MIGAAACFCLLAGTGRGNVAAGASVASLRADDAQLAAKSRAAVLDLYSLDARLAAAQARLTALRAEAATLQEQRVSIASQLRHARLDARLSPGPTRRAAPFHLRARDRELARRRAGREVAR